ncbi:hypothetical protein TELCIR_06642, partial [Teladorsagia circumcincta]
ECHRIWMKERSVARHHCKENVYTGHDDERFEACKVCDDRLRVTSINLQTVNNATEADILTHQTIPNMQSYPYVVILKILQALTLQSIVPVLAIFPAAGVFLLVQFGAVNNYVPSYLIVPCLSIGPLIDPMITIYYVHPYRKIANNEKENADEKKICYSFDAAMTITGPHVLNRTTARDMLNGINNSGSVAKEATAQPATG